MIITDIKKAITILLDSKYPTMEVMGEEISQDIKKPCFYVQIIPIGIINQGVSYDIKSFTIKIHYFPLVETNEECYIMSDNLSRIFRLFLAVLDRKLSIKQSVPKVIDKVLYFSFDLEFTDSITLTVGENGYEADKLLMQNLNLDQGVV